MFAIVNVKSEYSFLDSVVRVDDYLKTAERLGFQQVGIADVGNNYAAYRFAKKALALGLQPLLAIELTFELGDLPIPVNFLATNSQGYKNLLRILTMHNYGRTQFSEIVAHLAGLAMIVPETYGNLTELAAVHDEIFVGIDLQTPKNAHFLYPLLAYPSVRYLTAEDHKVLEVLHAVRDSQLFNGEGLTLGHEELLQRPEVYEAFFRANFPEALKNLENLTANIHYELEEELELPRFDKSRPADEHLRSLAEQGLKNRGTSGSAYQARLKTELDVIHSMGFDDYFLIVADLLRYARENGIYCGMGRGSAAGSLTAYALGITQVDPVDNHLLFERFLNPERVAMPDIDIDMPDDRRSELLAYMKNRYGNDHVAQIVTFSTLGKRQALRDVGKAYGLSEIELTGLTGLLAGHRLATLADEYKENPKFKAGLLQDKRLQRIYELAVRIEGMPRQTSVHASGVVLSEQSLINYVALKGSDDLALAQYEAADVEAIGLLKIDFLGLRNLSIIAKMRELVAEHKKLDVNPLNIDLEDEETLTLFAEGNSLGIFQFENPQMRRFLRNLEPTKFDDIVNATSIFRPGPSQFIPQFVARRHGKEAVPESDASIQDILAPTYGIMIYQEQIMQVAQRFAGFSLGKADLLRRAISKKKDGEFEKLRADFLAGAAAEGHSEAQATQIYDLIERFANYGFNRSHAYAYAALAFQIAYFKAHFPDEFFEVLLAGQKREMMLADALDNGLRLEPAAINRMPYHDRVSDGRIAIGLRELRVIPRDMAFWLVQNRPFESLSDLVQKLPESWQREDYLLPLVQIGAFDALDGGNRGQLAANVQLLIDYHQTFQLDMFKDMTSQLKFSYSPAEDYSQAEKYDFEKSLLGVGISEHPLQSLAQQLRGNFTPLEELVKNKRQSILVELKRLRTHRTKTGETMAFLTVSDSKQDFSVTLFPEFYRHFAGELEQGNFYFMTGKVNERNEELQLVADRIAKAELSEQKLWINLADRSQNRKLDQILSEQPGGQQVVLHFADTRETQVTQRFADGSEQLLKRLEPYVLAVVSK